MSADNWTICPKCEEARREESQQIYEKAANAYGKVSESEYHAMKEAARVVDATEPKQTLREDWEIGTAANGEFEVDYRSSCDECDYCFAYRVTIEGDEVSALAASQVDPVYAAARRVARAQRRK